MDLYPGCQKLMDLARQQIPGCNEGKKIREKISMPARPYYIRIADDASQSYLSARDVSERLGEKMSTTIPVSS